jgi:hypothetical protein
MITAEPSATQGDLDPMTVRRGPSMPLRATMATLLVLVGFLGPAFGTLAMSSWVAQDSSRRDLRGIGLPPPPALTWHDVLDQTRQGAIALSWVLILGAVFLLLNRRAVLTWPIIALWVSGTFVVPMALAGALFGAFDGGIGLLMIPLAIVAVLVAWLLVTLATVVLTRPVAADLLASQVEIPTALRGVRPRLRIQDHRLLLDRLQSRWHSSRGRIGLGYDALEFVQVGHVQLDTRWPLPNGESLALPAGPVLRIVGGQQQWLLPIAAAEPTVAAIRARAGRGAVRHADQLKTNADKQRGRAESIVADAKRFNTPASGATRAAITGPTGMAVCGIVGVLGAIAALAGPYVVHDSSGSGSAAILGRILGALFFAVLGVAALRRYRKYHSAARFLEDHPTAPAGTASTDPASAPISGWRADSVAQRPAPDRQPGVQISPS